jgi:UDP:flavonoid glycosyltransferase YjiC (YdhE family)
MRIAILASGSRGDVQPYVALGRGLQAAGHTVTIVAGADFALLVTEQDLAFVPTIAGVEMYAQKLQVEGGNMLKILAAQSKLSEEAARTAAAAGLQACRDADLIVAGLGGVFSGAALAEKLGIPLVQAYLYPFAPTQAFPSVLTPLPQTPLTRWANGPSHHLARQMMWQMMRRGDGKARREVLGMRAVSPAGPFGWLDQHGQLVLYGYSPAVLPQPADWDDRSHVTGYWFLDAPAGWQPPADLLAFLESGPAPVYIGFGSMASSDPRATAIIALEALRATGQRGVLFKGWGGLQPEDLPPDVFMIGSTPHSWLFPRMSAIVHHGGAGTTGAGLAAGVPSIVVPFFADQPFWGQRVYDLRVGPPPISRRRLTAENLSAAIRMVVDDQALRRRAADLGTRIRAEDGVGAAVQLIERAVRK